jgi:hypothetical protein
MKPRASRLIARSLPLLLLSARVAPACPICSTGTGDQVRAGIFDGHFLANTIALLLPFPLLLSIVVAVHFGWPRSRQRTRTPDSDRNTTP